MANGALQDDRLAGVSATINILDNPIFENTEDAFEPIRPYWENITFGLRLSFRNTTRLKYPLSLTRQDSTPLLFCSNLPQTIRLL